MMMLRLGLKEDEFQSFITNVYNSCKNLGVLPENVAPFLKGLIEFSKKTIVLFERYIGPDSIGGGIKEDIHSLIPNLKKSLGFQ
jgi:hypothetical protein